MGIAAHSRDFSASSRAAARLRRDIGSGELAERLGSRIESGNRRASGIARLTGVAPRVDPQNTTNVRSKPTSTEIGSWTSGSGCTTCSAPSICSTAQVTEIQVFSTCAASGGIEKSAASVASTTARVSGAVEGGERED